MKKITLPFVDVLKQRLKEPNLLMQFVSGPRQVGKTTGVQSLLAGYTGKKHHLIVEDEPTRSPEWLKEQWWYATSLGEDTLLVLDEIQKVPQWSETLKYLWDESKRRQQTLKCIFLGSSSLDLSRGTKESLAGRFELIQVPHWNFELSKQLHSDFELKEFIYKGGYPGSYGFLHDDSRWRQYLKTAIVESVLERDIFQANTIKKPALFRQLVELLAAYPAQVISYTKLLGQLQESGNVDIIKHYLELLKSSYLFYPLEKYSPKKVLQKASSPKIIPMCPALIETLAPEVTYGRRFEAYVGSQLLNLPGHLYYWQEGPYEVDFIYKNEFGKYFAMEVKSGKKKHSASLAVLLKKNPQLTPIIIDETVMIDDTVILKTLKNVGSC